MKLLRGVGRKLSLPILVLSLMGWMLYIVGFAVINNRRTFFSDYRTVGVNVTYDNGSIVLRQDTSMPAHRASLDWFPHWCVVIAGPFLFICMFLHLLIGRWFTGILTHFLTCLYLVCGGAVIYLWALRLFSEGREGYRYYFNLDSEETAGWLTEDYWGLWPLIEWVGCLSSVFFLTFFVMMWPCFRTKRSKQEAGEEYYEDEEYYDEEQGEEGEYQEEEEEGEMEEFEVEEGDDEEKEDEAPLQE